MPELRPRRLINSREWGLLCLFLLHATRWPMLRVSPQTSADNMEPHHETGFPTLLSSWLREIVLSVPEAARTTMVELIIGALLAVMSRRPFWR
jgi:hypothetical protein